MPALQAEQRLALRIGGTDRQHVGAAQVQRGEDIRRQLQRGLRVVVGKNQVAGPFTQRMHRLADVTGHQTRLQRQAIPAQPGNPFGEKPQGQRMRRSDLQHLALLALQVVQLAQALRQLFADIARRE